MIKQLLFASVLLTSSLNFAQVVPNGDLESWTNMGFYQEPNSWGTANAAIALGASATVSKSTDKHGGSFAAKLETISFDFQGAETTLPGFMILGEVDVFNQTTINGRPFTARPDSVGFWYKYAPVSGDEMNMFGELSRWDALTETHITIATFDFSSDEAKSLYTYKSVAFDYESLETPDSLTIAFFSSPFQGGQVGSVLFVDDITTVTNNTVSLPSKSEPVFKVYPNPAKDVLYVSLPKEGTIEIYNVLGSKMETVKSNGTDKTTIELEGYNNGVYILKTSTGLTQRFVVKH